MGQAFTIVGFFYFRSRDHFLVYSGSFCNSVRMEIDSESRTDSTSTTTDRTSKSSNIERLACQHSKLAYDGNFIRSASGVYMAGEIVSIAEIAE